MRGNERRIQDLDGASHSIRLADRDGALDPGDSVALLRLQAGPERGSRPVSAINYTQKTWVEVGSGASASLASTGVSRSGVWWFAMLAFMAAAIAIVWSDLRTFLVEVNDGIFGVLPDFHLIAWLDAQLPVLRGFDLAAQVPGLPDLLGSTGLVDAGQSSLVVTAALLVALLLVAYGARTWRIVWVPVFVAAVLAAGLMLGGDAAAEFSLAILGMAALVFVIAGLVNRIRDAARLRGRIARLSEHLLRHPPVESVTTPPPPRRDAPAMANPAAATVPGAASAASMAAVAAAVSGRDTAPDVPESPDSPEAADAADAARPDAGNTTDEDDLPSDAELEAARASLTADDQPDPAPLSNRSMAGAAGLDMDEPNDRDMILPPPPPMAGPAASAPAGESADTMSDAAESETAEPVVADEAQMSFEAESAPDSADVAVPDTPRAEAPAPDGDAMASGDAPDMADDSPLDLSGSDPMTSDDETADSRPHSGEDEPRRG